MRLKCDFETMELNGKFIAVPVGDEEDQYHGVLKLNDTAAFIFEQLKTDVDEGTIIEAMVREYNVSKDDAAADVHSMINSLTEKGLLIE